MIDNTSEHFSGNNHVLGCRTITIVCNIGGLQRFVSTTLEMLGLHIAPDASMILLLDLPYGSALRHLEAKTFSHHQVIVVTWNTCPESWERLWKHQPTVLLADVDLSQELPTALVRAAHGERYRRTPPRASELTAREQDVLEALARGWSNQRIAAHLVVQEKTVRNMLTTIYQKLGLQDRLEATLYYWGRHDLLAR